MKLIKRPLAAYACGKGAITMEEMFPVWMGDKQIGMVRISKIGLFYEVFCECSLPDTHIYRLHAQCALGARQLGILVPGDGMFTVRTKTCAAKMPLEGIRFFVCPADDEPKAQLMQICPQTPFERIDLLEEMSCIISNGKVYLSLNSNYSGKDT